MRTIAALASVVFLACPLLQWPTLGQELAAPDGNAAGSSPRITVGLSNGRTFTAAVDRRTSDEQLVLRFERPGIVLWRPIAWGEVASATIGNQPIPASELRAVAQSMRSDAATRTPGPILSLPSQQPTAGRSPAEEPRPALPLVTSITFDAQIANWDRDVEVDGLLVELWPLSTDGFLVPASGAVEVELFAPQRRTFHHAPRSAGDTIERVERWVRSVSPGDLTAHGVRLKLPFGAVHPEFDLDWIGVGFVHVKFAAPGHGVFEDSYDGVRIRSFAPLRDQLELKGGPRFLPTEGVGRWQ